MTSTESPRARSGRFVMVAVMATALGLASAVAVPGPAPAGTHAFSVHDMVAMERIGEPQPSPDGRRVVFTRRTYDPGAGRATTNLWVVGIDGGEPIRLTSAKASDTHPRWSPDGGTIAFISDRSGSSQIWSIDPAGGEARQRSTFPVDVDNVEWSPDGTHLAFTAEVEIDCPDLKCTASRDQDRDKDPVKARVYTRVPVRHWDTWEDNKRSHIFVWPVDGGTPVDIMKGVDADAPPKPFGGSEEFAWSPDGRSIAFTTKIRDDDAWSTDLDIYLAALDGGGVRCLTEPNEALDSQPAFSPDGRSLAWLAMARPMYEADRMRVTIMDLASRTTRVLTDAWDRSADSMTWTPDGSQLIVTAGDLGRSRIFSVEAATGKVTPIVQDHFNSEVGVAGSDRLVFLQDSLTSAAEVHTALLDGGDHRALTRINAPGLAAARMSTPEEFWFKGAKGDKVHGWILKPVDFHPRKKYPVAFLIHGGPQGAWDDHFHYRWNPQAYAGAGYVTVAINFHGSTGFGQAFTDAIRKNWGGAPYEDLMKGLDHVIASYDYVDGDMVCALGASYGGYMVNWIAGQTDRFRCLVSHDGEFDLHAGYYTTEELWFPEWEQGGPPWAPESTYSRWSPANHVTKWKTPMLVIHGARDYRLPDTEGLATFNALQRRGIPSKFVHFPDENHWVLKPANSIFWHETVLGWLHQWMKK